MPADSLVEGRPLLDLLRGLNSKVGAERLAASAVVMRAGSAVVPKILDALDDQGDEVMSSLWGEVLLQTIYATWLDDHLDLLQDAYFNRRGAVRKTLFELRGADALQFWIMCLVAPDWRTREESALMLRGLRAAAGPAVDALRDAMNAEEHADTKRTMADTLAILERY